MVSNEQSFRQVHLDFHTSPDISGIGSLFSKEAFQAALIKGNIDSITVFAKCHHSMCYYPTDIGIRHPSLDFDLTGAMVDAAHEIGVRAPIYITAGWSDLDAVQNPQWRAVNKDGSWMVRGGYDENADADTPRPHAAWHNLCLNDGSYAQHIYALTEEICKRYPKVDGLFYDICIVGKACYCAQCRAGMAQMGFDPENEEDAKHYFVIKRQSFMEKCNGILQQYHPGATIFFNSGGADMDKPDYHHLQSHFEMEDLPTAWGGYDKLPLRAKFFRTKGKPLTAMTGKFHLDWGEFGGYKTKEALKYEVCTMALYGAGASVGDHMHPHGEMDLQTYENIGYAYDYLRKIAPYCYGGENMAEVGVWLSSDDETNEGISNILLENQIDYDLIADNNFSRFSLVILPDKAALDESALAVLQTYLHHGGKMICMGDALVKNGKFLLNIGLEYLDEPEFECDYLLPLESQTDVPNGPMLCNVPGHSIRLIDAEVLAERMLPYFNRTYGHFCGHKNTPYNEDGDRFPGIVKHGNTVYVANNLPLDYFRYGCVFHKRWFMLALRSLYIPNLKISGLGSQGRCTMIHQPEQNRYCINMTYASPVRRGKAEIIEDIMPVRDVRVEVKLDREIASVMRIPDGQMLRFTQANGVLRVTLPEMTCHTALVLNYLQ